MSPTSDEIKKQEIVDQLVWNNSVDANDVRVEVINGMVTLEGTVPSYAAKMAAEREAYLVSGVTSVENLIEVELPAEVPPPGDVEIARNVESKLLWNNQINAAGISVRSENGVVTLTGSVDSYWEKNLAEGIAASSQGVMQVINELVVVPKISAIDADVEEDIRRAFRRSALVDETSVDVSVSNGIAHLSGTVPFYAMKREAIDIAVFTTGVVDVVDNISISYE